jgi:hypothetical protein
MKLLAGSMLLRVMKLAVTRLVWRFAGKTLVNVWILAWTRTV